LSCFQLPSTLFQSIAISRCVEMLINGWKAFTFPPADAAT
jgi:hypothetical protein